MGLLCVSFGSIRFGLQVKLRVLVLFGEVKLWVLYKLLLYSNKIELTNKILSALCIKAR